MIGWGATGTEVCSVSRLRCWILKQARDEFVKRLGTSGARIESENILEGAPWLDQIAELWTPITIAGISVMPIRSREEKFDRAAIAIIPGTGFGTGHHATTFLAGEFLRHSSISARPPKTVLDFGTGSGILALLCARLFACEISAIDNDPLALHNARQNLEINGYAQRIELCMESIEALRQHFDLIVANIYADLLIPLQHELVRCVNPGGHLILSGIPATAAAAVEQCYCAAGYQLIAAATKDGWSSQLFEVC